MSSHILAIPPIVIYIVYRLRNILIARMSDNTTNTKYNGLIQTNNILGILLCILAYLLKVYGSYTFYPIEYHIVSLPIFIAGLTLIVFNCETLITLIFPMAFLLFLIPPPFLLAQQIGSNLSIFSSNAAYIILKTLRIPVMLTSDYASPVIYLKTISNKVIPFTIDIACSGLYTLIGFAIFAVFVAYITREPLKKKLIIIVMGFPLIYALNILRIILIVLVGYIFGENIALNLFHLLGGWALILIGTLIIITVFEMFLNINIFNKEIETCNHPHKNDKDMYCLECGKILKIKPNSMSRREIVKTVFLMSVIISLLFIQVPVFALTEGAEVFIQQPAGTQTIADILPELEGYDIRFGYRDKEFEKISGQNASILYLYYPETPEKHIIWVGLEIASAQGKLHHWENCLITWPLKLGYEPTVTKLDLRDIHLLDNPPLSARYFAYQTKATNETQVILYWYTQSIFRVGEQHQLKWVKISLIEITKNIHEIEKIEQELYPVAKAIVEYWKPISNWSWISLAIARTPMLIILTTLLLIITLLINLYFKHTHRNHAKLAYIKITDPEDHQIIESVNTRNSNIVSEAEIASKYREFTGNNIDFKTLQKKLSEAEK
ncbi:MAG: exosortase/archaeosortase family protein, partial [Candidatus Hodarchaeota archaeon]